MVGDAGRAAPKVQPFQLNFDQVKELDKKDGKDGRVTIDGDKGVTIKPKNDQVGDEKFFAFVKDLYPKLTDKQIRESEVLKQKKSDWNNQRPTYFPAALDLDPPKRTNKEEAKPADKPKPADKKPAGKDAIAAKNVDDFGKHVGEYAAKNKPPADKKSPEYEKWRHGAAKDEGAWLAGRLGEKNGAPDETVALIKKRKDYSPQFFPTLIKDSDDPKVRSTIVDSSWKCLSDNEKLGVIAEMAKKAIDPNLAVNSDLLTIQAMFGRSSVAELGPLVEEAIKNGLPIDSLLAGADATTQDKICEAYARRIANKDPTGTVTKLLDAYDKDPDFQKLCKEATPPITKEDIYRLVAGNDVHRGRDGKPSPIEAFMKKADRSPADKAMNRAAALICAGEAEGARFNSQVADAYAKGGTAKDSKETKGNREVFAMQAKKYADIAALDDRGATAFAKRGGQAPKQADAPKQAAPKDQAPAKPTAASLWETALANPTTDAGKAALKDLRDSGKLDDFVSKGLKTKPDATAKLLASSPEMVDWTVKQLGKDRTFADNMVRGFEEKGVSRDHPSFEALFTAAMGDAAAREELLDFAQNGGPKTEKALGVLTQIFLEQDPAAKGALTHAKTAKDFAVKYGPEVTKTGLVVSQEGSPAALLAGQSPAVTKPDLDSWFATGVMPDSVRRFLAKVEKGPRTDAELALAKEMVDVAGKLFAERGEQLKKSPKAVDHDLAQWGSMKDHAKYKKGSPSSGVRNYPDQVKDHADKLAKIQPKRADAPKADAAPVDPKAKKNDAGAPQVLPPPMDDGIGKSGKPTVEA